MNKHPFLILILSSICGLWGQEIQVSLPHDDNMMITAAQLDLLAKNSDTIKHFMEMQQEGQDNELDLRNSPVVKPALEKIITAVKSDAIQSLQNESDKNLAQFINAADFLAMDNLLHKTSKILAARLVDTQYLKKIIADRDFFKELNLTLGSQDHVARAIGQSPTVKNIPVKMQQLRVKDQEVVSVSWNQEGTFLAGGGDGRTVKIWDQSGVLKSTLNYDRPVNAIALTPDGTQLAVAAGEVLQLVDTKTSMRETIFTSTQLHDLLKALAWNKNGTMLACGAIHGINIFAMPSFDKPLSMLNNDSWIDSVSFSADGSLLASAAWNNSPVSIWQVETLKKLKDIPISTVQSHSVAWSHEGARLALGLGNSILIMDALSDAQSVAAQGGGRIYSLAWSPDDSMIAAAEFAEGVRLYDANSGEQVKELIGEVDRALSVDWSSKNKIAAGFGNGLVRIWDVNNWSNVCQATRSGSLEQTLASIALAYADTYRLTTKQEAQLRARAGLQEANSRKRKRSASF